MGIIRQLPKAVINQIAAGEVVERPASVVKELLENAIDAQATRIDLSVERGGKDLIRVADNGLGMAPDDLVLAFQPHATSKLAEADDLFRIRTLGFRGEALAAISQVAKLRCQTRQAGAAEGSELLIDGGVFSPVANCGCSPGTVVRLYARGWQARRPSSRIRSATRPTLHRCPSRFSCAAARRHP